MISPRRSERGQMLVIVAVGLTALVAMAGLVIDGGMALTNRRQTQNAADSASLAGTRVLSLDIKWRATGSVPADRPFANADRAVCDAVNTALGYNENAGQEIAQIDCYAPGTSADVQYVNFARNPIGNVGEGIPLLAAGVRVNAVGSSETLLMRVVGISTVDVAALAIAVTGPTEPPIGALLPMVVQNPLGPFVAGKQYAIRTESPGECDVAAAPGLDTVAGDMAHDSGIVLAMSVNPGPDDRAPLAAGPPTPVASPQPQQFGASITVTLTAQSGATIYYTTDGSQPKKNTSPQYTGPLTFTQTTTLQAIAIGGTGPASDVGTFTYTQIPPPGAVTANPPSGTAFATSINVSLLSTAGATIHYTTDGTTPTPTSTVYGAPLTFTTSTQLKAIAVNAGVSTTVSSFTYPKDGETQPPESNQPDGTTFESGITIQLTSATAGAVIHYTTNGSEPTATSPVYDPSYGIVLTQTTTIRAFATLGGVDSVMVSFTYPLSGSSCPDLSAGNFGWVDFSGGSASNAELKEWIANPGTAPTDWYTRACTSLSDVNCRDQHDIADKSDDHWRLTGTSGHREVSLNMACTLYLGQEVYVPIWDRFDTISKSGNPNGHNAVFHLIGFGVFRVDGVIDNTGSGNPSGGACGDGLNFGGRANDKGMIGTYVSSLIGSQVSPCIPSADGTNPCQNLNNDELGINLAE
jgi:hypothetical protein